jgi:hypothetical protein
MVTRNSGNGQPSNGQNSTQKRELAQVLPFPLQTCTAKRLKSRSRKPSALPRKTSPAPLILPVEPINPKASAEAWIRHKLNKAIGLNYLSYSVGFKLRERDEVAAALERIERDPALRPWIDLVVLLDRSLTVWLKGGRS